MSMRKPITKTELRLFRESVIRDYKLKKESKKSNTWTNAIFSRMKTILPFNIALGLIAVWVFVWIYGWLLFLRIILQALITVTLLSTILAAVIRKK